KDGVQKPGLAGFDGVEIQYSVAKFTGRFTVSGPKASSRRRRPKRKMRGVPSIFAVQELLASQSPVACGFISRSCKGRLKGSETLKPNCKSSKDPSSSVAGAGSVWCGRRTKLAAVVFTSQTPATQEPESS